MLLSFMERPLIPQLFFPLILQAGHLFLWLLQIKAGRLLLKGLHWLGPN